MLIRACIDECSTHKDPDAPMMMYGCVSSMLKWARFDREWGRVLNDFKVPYAHAKSLIETDYPFNNWTKAKKLDFANAIDGIIRRRIDFGFATVLRPEDFREYRKHKELNSLLDSQYGVSARVALSFLHARCQLVYKDKSPDIYVVYEDGHANSGAFPALLKKMREEVQPCFIKSVMPVKKDECYGTQAADMSAYTRLQLDEKRIPRFKDLKTDEDAVKYAEGMKLPVFRLPITVEILTELRDAIILSKPRFARLYADLLSPAARGGQSS